jgi:hypothetical protein
MHTWQARTVHACLLAIATCWAPAALAADVIVGSVRAVRGTVFLDSGNGPQPLTVNATVHPGDAIVSNAGKAQIVLDDGTIISVGENSRVRIAAHERTANAAATRVGLVSGALRLFVAKMTPAGKFEVETETAIAAVRGTDWVIEATPEQTSVAIVSGVVAVSGRDGNAQATVVLDARRQGTDVRRGNPPTPVREWGAQRFSDTLSRATFE